MRLWTIASIEECINSFKLIACRKSDFEENIMKVPTTELVVKDRTVNTILFPFVSSLQILVALTFIQIVSRMSCVPTTYVISSYSNVRLQQPTMGLSVESQMPMDIMLNPILADEPPAIIDKMESIFMKGDQVKNVKSMNIDEKEIMASINKHSDSDHHDNVDERIYDEKDFIAVGNEQPVGFSVVNNVTESLTDSKLKL